MCSPRISDYLDGDCKMRVSVCFTRCIVVAYVCVSDFKGFAKVLVLFVYSKHFKLLLRWLANSEELVESRQTTQNNFVQFFIQ